MILFSHESVGTNEQAVVGEASLRLGKAGGSFHAWRFYRHGLTSPPMFIPLAGMSASGKRGQIGRLKLCCFERQYRVGGRATAAGQSGLEVTKQRRL